MIGKVITLGTAVFNIKQFTQVIPIGLIY
jgi:hypothetical protein